jgi:hypothetical protein
MWLIIGSVADVDDKDKILYDDTDSDADQIDSDVEEIDSDVEEFDSDVEEIDRVDVYNDEYKRMEMETSDEYNHHIMNVLYCTITKNGSLPRK